MLRVAFGRFCLDPLAILFRQIPGLGQIGMVAFDQFFRKVFQRKQISYQATAGMRY